MATHHLLSIFISLTIISVVSDAGITVDLIHRDSPRSPFSSNATSHVDKLYAAFQRSILRAREITRRVARANPSSVIDAPVYPDGWEYLVDLGIGTPPKRVLGLLDTGSDLMWTQCEPCSQCFSQDLPTFDPNESTSYGTVKCGSDACNAVPSDFRACTSNNTCVYAQGYDNMDSTSGDLATETLTLGFGSSATARITNFVFGCGHQNQGTFTEHMTGILGLGQGPLSLASQTQSTPALGGKFSYCLIPFNGGFNENVHSKLSFGNDAAVSGDDAFSTPVVSDDASYILTLKGVSVGDQTTRNGSGLDDEDVGQGNIIIDSGTTLTFLPKEIFDGLLSELKKQIKAKKVDDPRSVLWLCYEGAIEVPKITFHFPGVDLGLTIKNTFVQVAKNVNCLSMLPALHDIFPILGNLAQADFLIGHDLDGKR